MHMTDQFEGDTIKETEPITVHYCSRKMVGYGQLSNIICQLYSFQGATNRTPPLYEDQGT